MELDEDQDDEENDQAASTHDDFGEDFDEFEEGGGDDDDFGDFDEGFQQPTELDVDKVETVSVVSIQQSFSSPVSLLVSSIVAVAQLQRHYTALFLADQFNT